jgi:hypothetical protein
MTDHVHTIIDGQNESKDIRDAISSFLIAYKDPNRCDDIYSYLAQRKERRKNFNNKVVIRPTNIYEELAMTYDEYIAYLRDKYGSSQYDSYIGGQCASFDQRIYRRKEGLCIHHVAEQCLVDFQTLIDIDFARSRPFDLQRADNFIYCNYLEHLLLHVKIALDDICVIDRRSPRIDSGGAKMIWKELNQYYATGKVALPKKKMAELVADRYDDYLIIMTFLLKLIFNWGLKKYCPLDDFAKDVNGVMPQKIYKDLLLENYKKPDMWGDLIL